MGLLEDCKIYFGTDNLYSVLSVERNASEEELKKAYRKASLIAHPDKVGEVDREKATRKFQVLSKVHVILSDKEARAVYDETGCIDEENCIPEDRDWTDYWRLLFPKITAEDITNFFDEYRRSEEEKEDLKECYIKYEGDMDLISECFLGYEFEHEDRYREILNDLIKKEEIPAFPKFVKETKAKRTARKKRIMKEAAEAEKMKQAEETDQSLVNALARKAQDREASFNAMIQGIESKYCKKETTGRKKKKV